MLVKQLAAVLKQKVLPVCSMLTLTAELFVLSILV